MGIDYVHWFQSDGKRGAADVCAIYREAGYDFLALTDHFMAKYNYPIVDTRPFRTKHFTTILGAELHAPATSLGELWHILAVGGSRRSALRKRSNSTSKLLGSTAVTPST